MKCPLPYVYLTKDSSPPQFWRVDCLEEGCAWWNDVSENCTILSIGLGLAAILLILSDIRKRMPKDLAP